MATISRVVVTWQGTEVIGGGVSVFHFAGSFAPADMAQLHTAFDAVKSLLTSSTTIIFPNSGVTLDSATGIVGGSWSTPAAADVVGTGNANAFSGAGVCVTWHTTTVIGRKLLRGRTFLVPTATSVANTDGALTPAGYTTLNAFGAAMQAGPAFGVWHRNSSPSAADGVFSVLSGFSAKNKVAILTSRRD